MLPRVNLVRAETGEFLTFGHDLISQHLFTQGQWENGAAALTQVFLAGIDTPLVLDIGANLGAYAVPVAKALMQAGGSVIAVEAQRIVYYQLCGNVFLNQLDNVTALHLAIGHERGTLDLPRPNYAAMGNVGGFSIEQKFREHNGTQAAMTGETERVQMLPLDELEVPRAPDFIKIDVEGFELNVLQGAKRFLARHNFPPLLFEAWSEEWFAEDKLKLLGFVQSLGYAITPLLGYDHIAQHPSHRVAISFQRNANGFNVARVK